MLERRVALVQPRCHVVELAGNLLELIAAPDLDAVAELARADPLGAFAEHGQRAHHLAADQEGDQECHRQAISEKSAVRRSDASRGA